MSLVKNLVIDTSVFIYDPEALSFFESAHSDTTITIPFTVLEELESWSNSRNDSSKNATRALSNIRAILEQSSNKTVSIVKLAQQNTLEILALPHSEDKRGSMGILDFLKVLRSKRDIIFVTKSLGRRVRVESLGILSRDYENTRCSFRSLYRGHRKLEVQQDTISELYKGGHIDLSPYLDEAPKPNEYFLLSGGGQHFGICSYNKAAQTFKSLQKIPSTIWGIKPMNDEQRCALDLLLRDDIKLVTLIGHAGSGKTVLALAAAMYQVFDQGQYNKLLISRPIVPMGKDIGFLPGMKEDKLMHWMQPIYDNLELLFDLNGMNDFSETVDSLLAAKKLEMEALTYIRGRSLSKAFMIIDEAQNLTPHEIKTIISRAGQGTKIVLTGDPTQIDSPYFDENSNGLTYLVGKFHHLDIYGHMFLSRTERSELAAVAARIL